MDRLEAMSLLVTVAEEGNFSAAARRLGKPLSTVHRHISALEAHLGSRLLHRTTRHTALTEAGAAYLAASKGILDQVDEAERAVRGEYAAPRGELIVTAPVVFGRLYIAPLIADFIAIYPDIDVRVLLVDRVVHLMEEHIDVALRIGVLADSSLIAQPVGRIRWLCCASPEYLATRGHPAHPCALASHQCIAVGAPNERHAWSFNEQGHSLSQIITPRLTITTAEGAIAAAKRGAGITRILSYQVTEAMRNGNLETTLEPFEPAAVPASLVYHSQPHMPRKTRVLIDFLKPKLCKLLAAQAGAQTSSRT